MSQETAGTKAKVTLYVHRCHWCGKQVAEEPTSLKLVESVTIVCSECLNWRWDLYNTIKVTKLSTKVRVDIKAE